MHFYSNSSFSSNSSHFYSISYLSQGEVRLQGGHSDVDDNFSHGEMCEQSIIFRLCLTHEVLGEVMWFYLANKLSRLGFN